MDDLTQLLRNWAAGDEGARNRALDAVHAELLRLARYYMSREREGHTLQATALVNEAYLRLVGVADQNWHNRAHFVAVAAHLMRQVLVDHARRHRAAKRNEGIAPLAFDEALGVAGPDLLDVHEALLELEKVAPRTVQILEMQAFGGLSNLETATALEVSESTVARELRAGRAWVTHYLKRGA